MLEKFLTVGSRSPRESAYKMVARVLSRTHTELQRHHSFRSYSVRVTALVVFRSPARIGVHLEMSVGKLRSKSPPLCADLVFTPIQASLVSTFPSNPQFAQEDMAGWYGSIVGRALHMTCWRSLHVQQTLFCGSPFELIIFPSRAVPSRLLLDVSPDRVLLLLSLFPSSRSLTCY